ncbi:MAG: hypothetical protein JSS75_12085 [Bacteroidetes bacterium]|nr:hypothetical protein [Bacteroidota bacterium]
MIEKRWGMFVCMLALGALALSCAKEMDNQQPGQADTTAHGDSIRATFYKTIAQKLPGIWVRRDSSGIEQGYNLLPDGRLMLVGATSNISGIHWSLTSDTLTLYTHAEPDTTPIPHVYFIKAIDDSALSFAAPGAPNGYNENYHRRTGGVPQRYVTLYRRQFEGIVAPGQIMKHTFDVESLFDGGISLSSDSADVKFYLLRGTTNLTPSPVREYNGRFAPGEYTVRVMYIYQGRRKGANADYNVRIEER